MVECDKEKNPYNFISLLLKRSCRVFWGRSNPTAIDAIHHQKNCYGFITGLHLCTFCWYTRQIRFSYNQSSLNNRLITLFYVFSMVFSLFSCSLKPNECLKFDHVYHGSDTFCKLQILNLYVSSCYRANIPHQTT